MKTFSKFLAFALVLMLAFLPLQSAQALGLADSNSGRFVFGSNFTLDSGDTLNGDLVVVAGTALIEEGATVNGSVVMVAGSLIVRGKITGDVVTVAASAQLADTARIGGSVVTAAASLDQQEGADVEGDIVHGEVPNIPAVPEPGATAIAPIAPRAPDLPDVPKFDFDFNPLGQIGSILFQSVALGVLAILVLLFLPNHVRRTTRAVVAQPLLSGGVGFMSILAVPTLAVLLAITLILSPISLLLIFTFVLASVFGWIALGLEVGNRFAAAVNQNWSPALASGVGTFLLTLVINSIGMIPCVGWIASFVFGIAGLGAVVLTRFGTKDYPTDVATESYAAMGDDDPLPPAA